MNSKRGMSTVASLQESETPKADFYETVIEPAGHRVLIFPDQVSDQRGSLYVPQTTREREQFAQIFGTVVKVGLSAWKAFDDGTPWAKVGDRVAISKYGGFVIEDPANKFQYRLINDEDVTAVIRSGETPRLVDEAV